MKETAKPTISITTKPPVGCGSGRFSRGSMGKLVAPQTQTPMKRKSIFSVKVDLVACSTCKRSFQQDRIGKHESICAAAKSRKPRPVFDCRSFDPVILAQINSDSSITFDDV